MRQIKSLFLIGLSGILWASSAAAETPQPEKTENSWHLLAGFGSSHPGWGNTQEHVETQDLILRYERPQSVFKGQGWYRNRRSIFIETAFHHLVTPDEPPMFGLYFQSCWTFRPEQSLRPYLMVGGGGVYTQAEIPGTSSKIKGSYQAAGGLRFDLAGSEFTLEYRFHHLSNGGRKDPNDPLNSDKFLFGIKLNF